MISVEVKPVQPYELEVLQRISCETFEETFGSTNSLQNMNHYVNHAFSVDQLRQQMANPSSAFFFAWFQNQVAGYLKLNFETAQTEKMDSQAVEIERIYVLKAFQGKQVGQSLFVKATSVARQRQASFIWLGVWEHNTKAIAFYQRNGFDVFDKHLFVLGADVQTDLLMRLKCD